MELTLLRHGIPIEPDEWSASDSTRPLTPEGRVQARAVIATLARAGRLGHGVSGAASLTAAGGESAPPFEIWTSPYVRTEQTARVAAEVLGVEGARFKVCPALASGSDLLRALPMFLASLSGARAGGPPEFPERLICVGHQPDLGLLVSRLCGEPDGRYALGRGGTARLVGDLRAGGMKLEWLFTAEEALSL